MPTLGITLSCFFFFLNTRTHTIQEIFFKLEDLTRTYVVSAAEGIKPSALRLKTQRPAAELSASAVSLRKTFNANITTSGSAA